MKWVFLLCGILNGACLQANTYTFSKDRMEAFYQVFVSEEREILEEANVVKPEPVPVPPSNPPPPPFIAGYLPFVLVNNSTLPDSSVNIVVTGDQPSDHTILVFVQFNSSGVGSLVDMIAPTNSSVYSKTLNQFPLTSEGNRVMYIPNIDSSRVWVSMNEALDMPVTTNYKLTEPDFTSAGCTVNFDKFEFAYLTTGTNVSVNATAVDFFSIPLYLYVSTATSTNSTTGLYQPRSYCMRAASKIFATAPEKSQWNGLFLKNGSSILRLLSTGKAMTASPSLFDENYWDNAAAYGYSFIDAIWSGISSFYRNNPLKLTIPVTGNPTYTGVIQPDNSIIFNDGAGNLVTFRKPSPPDYVETSFTTSGQILSATPLYISETVSGDGVQVSKLFEEAIVAGLIPTADTLSNDYLTAHTSSYYTINPNLSEEAQNTGPWYDVYSKAIHSLGSIYSFGFDEPLWPDVAVSSGYSPTSTYVGVTIGSIN